MRVLVTVKQVADTNVKVRVKEDGSGVQLDNVKMSINPFDEVSVEAAVRLKEKGDATELVVVSIGPAKAEETLRHALAMGADRAVLVLTDVALEPLAVAKVLKRIVEEEQPGLVLVGKQAVDGDNNQTGQMLAALLDWPQATFASGLELVDGEARVTREADGGMQTIAVCLPAVVTTDLRLNEPRFASLPNIMKAKKKPLDVRDIAGFGIDITPRIEIVRTEEPVSRKRGIMVGSVSELVDRLKNEGLVQ